MSLLEEFDKVEKVSQLEEFNKREKASNKPKENSYHSYIWWHIWDIWATSEELWLQTGSRWINITGIWLRMDVQHPAEDSLIDKQTAVYNYDVTDEELITYADNVA